jgi:hypothetical protein
MHMFPPTWSCRTVGGMFQQPRYVWADLLIITWWPVTSLPYWSADACSLSSSSHYNQNCSIADSSWVSIRCSIRIGRERRRTTCCGGGIMYHDISRVAEARRQTWVNCICSKKARWAVLWHGPKKQIHRDFLSNFLPYFWSKICQDEPCAARKAGRLQTSRQDMMNH